MPEGHTKTREGLKVVATNRRATFEYFIDETYEAGIVLQGSEIKSLRAGKANLADSYVQIHSGEAWLYNCHISPYHQAGPYQNHEPKRPRKLLLHNMEIIRLATKVKAKGFTIIPLRIYLKNRRAKVEIALVRGKKLYDKRDAIADREIKREMDRARKQDYDRY
ncbi:MAG: SsrA-binding protein SmpB [Chloroflexi bacterium]|nr:SsrA-binding protein SmpB [Chloroflexota bacterium]